MIDFEVSSDNSGFLKQQRHCRAVERTKPIESHLLSELEAVDGRLICGS